MGEWISSCPKLVFDTLNLKSVIWAIDKVFAEKKIKLPIFIRSR